MDAASPRYKPMAQPDHTPHADFFSFGTNDLTQLTYGYSRDDINSFLPEDAYNPHHEPKIKQPCQPMSRVGGRRFQLTPLDVPRILPHEAQHYNGEGPWSAAEITARYLRYAADANITPRDLAPRIHETTEGRWIYPVMDSVIDGIEAHDAACIRIGLEFIEEDQSFSFGALLKSNTARALRRAPLTPEQGRRALRRIFSMLERGYVPPEYHEYAKLARNIGYRSDEIPMITPSTPRIAKYLAYFHSKALPKQGG